MKCGKCDGDGQVRIWNAQDELVLPETCSVCKGSGEVEVDEVDKILANFLSEHWVGNRPFHPASFF